MPEPSDYLPDAIRFIEVALPLPPRQTFTYGLPPGLSKTVKLGARVLVPFGKRVLTGYVVALHERLDLALGIDESAVKNIAELIDEEPLITAEILALTRWAADYYAASWGEMLKASLPAGINSAVEQVLTINQLGREYLFRSGNIKPIRVQILKRLANTGSITRRELEKEFGTAATQRAIRALLLSTLVDIHDRAVAEKVKAKRRKAVRLLEQVDHANGDDKPLTATQQRIVDAITVSGGEMIFTEVLERADAGASSINTLAKRGMLEVFTQEVLRDPLADTSVASPDELTLNPEQSFVLSEIESALTINPDVVVISGEPSFADQNADLLLNPTVIVEIVSNQTNSSDKTNKLENYLAMDSIKEFVLLKEEEMRVEHYARQNAKQWIYRIYNERDDVISLESIQCKISLTEVYAQLKTKPAELSSKAVN